MSKKRSKKSSSNSSKPKKSLLKQMESDEDRNSRRLLQKEESLMKKISLFFHLHIDNYESKHGRRLELFFFLINFLAIIHFFIDTYDFSGTIKTILITSELILVSIFIIEYAARMHVAQKKIRHFFNIYSLIDLIAILPVVLTFLAFAPIVNLGFVRIFRILRVFRVMRVMRVLRFQRALRSSKTIFGKLTESKLIIARIILIIITIIFVSSGFIWAIESRVNPDQFNNIWSAMYFSIVTMATVGYGDIIPLSWLGKVVTVIMILSGIALIPWQVGKLIKVAVQAKTKKEITCAKCGLTHHDFDAVHCKLCGEVIKKKGRGKEVELKSGKV